MITWKELKIYTLAVFGCALIGSLFNQESDSSGEPNSSGGSSSLNEMSKDSAYEEGQLRARRIFDDMRSRLYESLKDSRERAVINEARRQSGLPPLTASDSDHAIRQAFVRTLPSSDVEQLYRSADKAVVERYVAGFEAEAERIRSGR